jgi:hypothetical protein
MEDKKVRFYAIYSGELLRLPCYETLGDGGF